MRATIEDHIAAADALYRPRISAASDQLTGSTRLLTQFDQAVIAFRRHGRRQVSGVVERVNELAVAHRLLSDATPTGATIHYEPGVVTGPKFDFMVTGVDGRTHYLEVKTVSPRAAGDQAAWHVPTFRGRRLSLGARVAGLPGGLGNTAAAQASFLRYALETETKLAAHVAVRPGQGWLVVCGDGASWEMAALEEFAQFYQTGKARDEDPFADREWHAFTHDAATLSRSLDGFAALIRPQAAIEPTAWVWPVAQPSRFTGPVETSTPRT